jgi:glycerophosphoryl diester phosphodiesterase
MPRRRATRGVSAGTIAYMIHAWHPAAANRPAVFAHRGASSEIAEHTLTGYERALEVGSDGLECDVRLTADGHLVCVHDRRIDRTSTGSGVVAAKTLDQLQQFDFGSWWSGTDDLPDLDIERRSVLTLARLLELVSAQNRPVRLLIETKHPTRYGGFLERSVVATLERFGLARPPRDGSSPVAVMSFSEIALRRMRDLAPGVPTVLLMDRVPVRLRTGFLPYGAAIAGPSVEILQRHPDYVRRVHDSGKQMYTWVVDRLDEVDMCVGLGVDAIITNRPQQVLQHLAARQPGRPSRPRSPRAPRPASPYAESHGEKEGT